MRLSRTPLLFKKVSMQEKLKILIFTAKILQFCADVFALFGIVLFIYIFFSNYKENPAAAVSDPFFIGTILIPFVPAAVMAWAAAKKRKQIRALLDGTTKSS